MRTKQFIWAKKPLKSLLSCCATVNPGRNNRGIITVNRRSSSLYFTRTRLINNKIFSLKNEFGQIIRVELDPKRSAFIALVRLLKSGFLCYISIPASASVGSFIALNPTKVNFQFFKKLKIYSSVLPLCRIKRGSFVCNFENFFMSGAKICRSSGSKAKIQSFSFQKGLVSLLLPSGKTAYISIFSHAFTGSMSNSQHYLNKFYKAGQTRILGRRPKVRGVAMNPVDHPHGGGEGKTSGGRASVTPWGTLTKGFKTISSCVRKRHTILRLKFLSKK
jgi:large subunit ribosomal protein L2